MTVKARPYFYENGRYVSPRQLRERYGTASLVELQARHPERFQQSRVEAAGFNDLLLSGSMGQRRLYPIRIGVDCVADHEHPAG